MPLSCKLERQVRVVLVGAAAVLLQAVALSGTAHAQYYHPGPRDYFAPVQEPSARERAHAIVRSLGLRPVSRAERHGPVFIVEALGQEGTPVEVTLDRRSGRVLGIVRLGPSRPRIARVPPDAPREEDEQDDFGYQPRSMDGDDRSARERRESRSGPSVITREGVERDDLPAPRSVPRGEANAPDVTGSVPQSSARSPADPLNGVPREFRGPAAEPDARIAARPPAPRVPESAPLPRPRPGDAPAVARQESPKTVPEPQAKPKPAPEKVPDAQTFE